MGISSIALATARVIAMYRIIALAMCSWLMLPAARGQEIPADVLYTVKKATVFVKVDAGEDSGTGSGFVIASGGTSVFVATNHHVIEAKNPKGAVITIVFDSGTPTERSARAEVVAMDKVNDLAVLRINGLTDPPKPISYISPPQMIETMSLYSFGFPFGQKLASGRTNPAMTVGKASVSSLRLGEDGELETVQVDGAINPGNSGGPVVDTRGRLCGIAVATIQDSGIGFAVPAIELERMMLGRFGNMRIAVRKEPDGRHRVRFEADVLDPMQVVRSGIVYYAPAATGEKPKHNTLDRQPGAKAAAVTIAGGVASAEFLMDRDGDVHIQAIPEGSPGRRLAATRIAAFPLRAPPAGFARGDGDIQQPPAAAVPPGWKEHVVSDRSFSVSLPNGASVGERGRTVTQQGENLKFMVLQANSGALTFRAALIELPAAFAAVPRNEIQDAFRSIITGSDNQRGTVTSQVPVRLGAAPGVEYRIEDGASLIRTRVFVAGAKVYLVEAAGPRGSVIGSTSTTFLVSFRAGAAAPAPNDGDIASGDPGIQEPPPVMTPRPPTPRPPVPTPRPTLPTPGTGEVKTNNEPTILGTHFNPAMQDPAPKGGVLIGVEVGIGKFFHHDIVKGGRPIYLTDGKESFGKQFGGKDILRIVTLKAKPGYAVGALTAKTGLGINGFSLTFMKLRADGLLDSRTAYESDWAGGLDGGGPPRKTSGNGAPVVGFIGRVSKDNEFSAVGLIFDGQQSNAPHVTEAPQQGAPIARPTPRPTNPSSPSTPATPAKPPTDAKILGGVNDPVFADEAPKGALLVGFEIGLEKYRDNDAVRAVRPIFRAGDKESFGQQHGNAPASPTTVKARAGYAVGAISARSALTFNCFYVTFMKVQPDGTLDPKDAYDSAMVGHDDRLRTPTKLGGDGVPVTGIVGKTNPRTGILTGMGLLIRVEAK